jgi:hypothetical protein
MMTLIIRCAEVTARQLNEQAQALLRKAEECENAAQRARDDEIHLAYLELARQHRAVARYAQNEGLAARA